MTERAIPLSVFGQVTSNIEWREQMDLKEAIYSRRAVRNFPAESIDKKRCGNSSTPPFRRPARSISNHGHFRSCVTRRCFRAFRARPYAIKTIRWDPAFHWSWLGRSRIGQYIALPLFASWSLCHGYKSGTCSI